MTRWPAFLAICALSQSAMLLAQTGDEAAEASSASPFVGRYDGSKFETAAGMQINADGTWEWALAVGALDARSGGVWETRDGVLHLRTTPKPVPPEFRWARFETRPDAPFLSIVLAGTETPFDHASLRIVCADGNELYDDAALGIWSPTDENGCEAPTKMRFRQPNYDLTSATFDLTGPLKPKPGQTLVFEFHPNDIGVVDFTGTTGTLDGGLLQLKGSFGNETLRKLSGEPQETDLPPQGTDQ